MKSLRKSVFPSVFILLGVLLAIGIWASLSGFWSSSDDNVVSNASDAAPTDATADAVVELTPTKLAKANIQSSVVQRCSLQDRRTIPGRLQYNQTRHIELRAPTEGTLQSVLVKPGDAVEPGTPVVVFESPEIGKARSEILHLEAQLDLATRRWKWEEQIVSNTQALIEILTNDPELDELESAFKKRTLGQARQTLMAAYSEYRLANQLLAGTESLSESGVIPMKTIQERIAKQRAAEAAFRAATEQVLFDSRARSIEAEAGWKRAEREVAIGRQKLKTLLGYAEKSSLGDFSDPISRVELCSPIAGTVEQIRFAPNERVSQSDSLLVIADTKTLWVSAEIRDNDWAATRIAIGDEIEVQTPALSEESVRAKVVYIGREVSEQTHALPLVAEIANPNGKLRPGMFVRVNVPIGQPRERLAIRPAALMQHEGETFVFVEDGTGRFRRVDVATGMETPEWVEIREGLTGGEQVVDQGAFVLKSELLLEGEEE